MKVGTWKCKYKSNRWYAYAILKWIYRQMKIEGVAKKSQTKTRSWCKNIYMKIDTGHKSNENFKNKKQT